MVNAGLFFKFTACKTVMDQINLFKKSKILTLLSPYRLYQKKLGGRQTGHFSSAAASDVKSVLPFIAISTMASEWKKSVTPIQTIPWA